MSKSTPMMQQYREIKAQYPDAILFFRLGDFYEMFFDDAVTAARALDIVLTARDGGPDGRVPMCGVPCHSADTYIARLIERGYRVAICEQVEDPAGARGLVRREVVRVVTPGTVLDPAMLDEGRNNYLVALVETEERAALAAVDVSTGEFLVTEVSGQDWRSQAMSELYRLQPVEALVPARTGQESLLYEYAERAPGLAITEVDPGSYELARAQRAICDYFAVDGLEAFGLQDAPLATIAAGAVTAFLNETQKGALSHIRGIVRYSAQDVLGMDMSTRRSLELTRTARDGTREGSLLWVLDLCVTSMGRRLLRQWLERPLLDVARIAQRLDAVEELVQKPVWRSEVRRSLAEVHDLERLAARISSGSIQPREARALHASLAAVPGILAGLAGASAVLLADAGRSDPLDELRELLDRALEENPPATSREGGVIRAGFDRQVDELRQLAFHGQEWLLEFERRERERTGIKSLKVGFNRVFGYYLEVTRANADLVPPHYVRKQTLVNAERYITDELKAYEDRILGARERLCALEHELFLALRAEMEKALPRVQTLAAALARVDVLAALAECAHRYDYVRPVVDNGDRILIRGGRHPVVERCLHNEAFVPNDVRLDGREHRHAIITGPNMGGKSTYMRQVALIVVMAQMGSFVPAREAVVGCVDQVFARVGAADDLAGGQSTFMVEMVEVAGILARATRRSLVILDEIGRGTSTFDGMSIARAVMEYLCRRIGAKTLLATHYHELTSLGDEIPGVINLSVSVKETAGGVVFLKRVLPGRADKSYGIHVAALAGLPGEVVRRAEQVLEGLEQQSAVRPAPRAVAQPSLFAEEEHPLLTQLRSMKLDEMRPVEALNTLHQWQLLLLPERSRRARAR